MGEKETRDNCEIEIQWVVTEIREMDRREKGRGGGREGDEILA